jgi:tRNA threonylcarbamoyladenosine biosynthesis protein TsaB
MVIALKTADPTAELYLFTAGVTPARERRWEAGRNLAHDLLGEIEQILQGLSLQELTGLVVYTGPGSFTGLRIGITTMNTMAYSLDIPIVGTNGDDWAQKGLKRLENGENDKIVLPEYGAPANITKPKR